MNRDPCSARGDGGEQEQREDYGGGAMRRRLRRGLTQCTTVCDAVAGAARSLMLLCSTRGLFPVNQLTEPSRLRPSGAVRVCANAPDVLSTIPSLALRICQEELLVRLRRGFHQVNSEADSDDTVICTHQRVRPSVTNNARHSRCDYSVRNRREAACSTGVMENASVIHWPALVNGFQLIFNTKRLRRRAQFLRQQCPLLMHRLGSR
jgi:hypothetical protein